MRILYTILFTATICLPASATIINIPDDYPTIQEGIDASFDGDTVLVQPQTYVENINFNGHNIVLGSLFLTTGDTTYISQTIIDGDSSGSVVTFENGEDSTTVIAGLTIQKGYRYDGGGIKCENNSNPIIDNNIISENYAISKGSGIYWERSNPTISNNHFYGNSAGHDGGAILCHVSSSMISNNIFIGNSADCGAAICCEGADPTIINNTMIENSAYYRGGGICCLYDSNPNINNNRFERNTANYGGGIAFAGSDATFSNNIIFGNSADGGGGIFCSWSSSPVISSNTIYGNTALSDFGYGGGIYCGAASSPTIINNTITGNIADVSGGGMAILNASYPQIVNAILWDNYAPYDPEITFDDISWLTIIYCNIQGGWEGEGNIDSDPLFRDPDNGDFHLMSTACGHPNDSPCIDVGSPAIIDSLLDCSWGLGTILSDMGAYGGGDSATVGIIDIWPPIPNRFALLQNYPNPFNKSTTISLSLPEAQLVIITVYDILGREIQTLLDEYRQAGVHRITFHASDLASGIYFYRLHTGELDESRRMILMK